VKPSTKAELALNGMVELARRVPAAPVSLAILAEKQSISLSYLEQIFAALRRRGLVLSVRGPGGGYLLARPAGSISTGDIIDAVDETNTPARDAGTEGAGNFGDTRHFWQVMHLQVLDLFRTVSLQDLLDGSFQNLEFRPESAAHAAE
jgi:Rrf2 family transcriptional regulator, iron-sulfur cluster assembly transcription factor